MYKKICNTKYTSKVFEFIKQKKGYSHFRKEYPQSFSKSSNKYIFVCSMLQYLNQDHEIRKKVFFKPQISSEMKFTPIISPQFINDTNLLYMGAYDFMAYNTDEESFSLLHRPLPSQEELKKSQQEFINVNFGRSTRQRANEIFYLIKNSTEQQERYFLGRRINSVNHEYQKKLIARNKKVKKQKFNVQDIDNLGNIRQKKPKTKSKEEQVPDDILQFRKQFIVKHSLSLIIFVVKKEQKQPQIKLSVKDIPQVQQGQDSQQLDFSNPSLPSTKKLIRGQSYKEKQQKQYKNHLLIYSYSHHQTMTFQLDESVQSAFQISQSSSNLICTTEKFVYLLNFEVKNVYVPNKMSSNNFEIDDKTSYQDSARGYLNSDIKVQVLDKSQLEFYIQTEGMLSKNFFSSLKGNNSLTSSVDKNKKKNRKNRSVAFNSILRDRRVSSILKQQKRNSEKSNLNNAQQNSENKQKDFKKSKQSQLTINPKPQQCESVKVIKKALRILPLSFFEQEFIIIVYVISKVLCTGDSIETLSFQYQSRILSVQSQEMFEIDFQQHITKINRDPFANTGNAFQEPNQLREQGNGEKNVLKFVNQLGDIAVNKGVILVWQKFQPVIHEIIYKVDYRTSDMVDLSDPKNLKSQKTIINSVNHILQYRNKITLYLDSNLIRQIIISPTSQNFFILTGRNHLNNQYRDQQFENYDVRPEDVQQKYDVDDYLIFQYDLFAELWSSDASVYLKNVPLCYQKRKVQEIAPFTLKNQVLALTGKKVHQMHKSLLDGILDFDLHPYGYFIAVSFGFNAKIYSLEHDTLNLIYTYNAQNIKKMKYSPNGSDLVIMSQKTIKILDSYSFAIKYILQEKSSQCSFTNFAFSSSGLQFSSVYDNLNINIHDGHSYNRISSIKPGQSTFLGAHDKILAIVPDTQEKFCLALLENGKIYFRWNDDAIVIRHEKLYEYSDSKKINCLHYDSKKGVLFCGLQKGMVRAHIWPIKNESSYSFDTFSQFKFGYSLITAIKSSFLASTVYIGDINGNLTTSKFIIEKQKKVTGELRPNNYYVNASYGPMMNIPRNELQTLQKSYKYVLGSSAVSQDGQKMKLEYKLNEIITKMNDQMKKFKRQMREKLIQKQGMAKCKLNFNKLYNSQKSKLTEISHQLKYLKQKQAQQKSTLTTTYEAQLKKIIYQQNELIKQKGLQLSKNMMGKAFLRQMNFNQLNTLKQQQLKVENQYTGNGLKGMQLMIREQQLVPYDEVDYVPQGFAQVKKQLVRKLESQLVKQQQKNYQLKQQCTYMQNAISNLQLRSIKQETLQFRVNIELQQMQSKLNQQGDLHQNLKQELKQAQNKINQTQAQVLHRNPQFSKNIQGSAANDDACTYKLWVKDKMVEQVQLLFDHYNNLNEIMDQKQQDIIDVVTYKNKIVDSFQSLTKKRNNMKYYIHQLKDHLISVNNQLSQLKFSSLQYQGLQQISRLKLKRNEQLEKVKLISTEQNVHQQKKPIKLSLFNLKDQMKQKNIEKDKRQIVRSKTKNQTLIVKNKVEDHQHIVRNLTHRTLSRNLSQNDSFVEDSFKNVISKSPKTYERSKFAQQKVDEIIQQVDEKVKNQWKNHQTQKSSPQTTFRSSSQKLLTKRWKKLKSQKRSTQNLNSFSYRLIERLRQKQQEEIQQSKNRQFKKVDTINERVIPFSATSSPQMKKMSSNFNLFQKSNKFLKNNVKIHQRKQKRLNAEKSELISQFEMLRYENKQLQDKQALVQEGIDFLNQQRMNQTSNGSFKNNTESNIKMLLKTPFQKYVEQKSKKVSLNNTMPNFKESMTSRQKSTLTSQNLRNNFNFTSTAFNSPKNISPIKHSQSLSFFKKK